jgi:hypothetical protein
MRDGADGAMLGAIPDVVRAVTHITVLRPWQIKLVDYPILPLSWAISHP